MDPSEIIKAAPEIIKTVAPVATGTAIAFTGIVKRMLGPAADEVAEMLRDRVRLYRYGNQMRCIEKAEKMAKDAGFTPSAVAPKILFPLLEGASMEEDESLHDMWAALLANAASPENAGKVRPGIIATLKTLAPDEAALLNHLFTMRTGIDAGPFNVPFEVGDLLVAHSSVRLQGDSDPFSFHTCIQSLQAEQLVEQIADPKHTGYLTHSYALTVRGLAFVFACLPPKPKP
jgi:hypothetical protein